VIAVMNAGKAQLDELREAIEQFGTVVESPEPPDFLL
jgi:hypothetical protein